MATKKRATTLNRGAADEREAIKDHLKRLRKAYMKPFPWIPELHWAAQGLVEDLLKWLGDRSKRARAKEGGIGPKAKKAKA